jgi:predicted Zn-dependent protease
MRRADWVAVALVGTVAAGVGGLIFTAPRPQSHVAAAPSDTLPSSPDSTAAASRDGSATVALTGPRGREVRGRQVRSGNPAPVRDLEEIQRHIRLGAPGTYIQDIIDEQDAELVRWPEATVFRVWIAPTTTATEWRPEYVDSVRAAFTVWAAAGAPIGAQFISDSAAANVRIHWTDRFEEGGTIGQTLQTWDQYRWLVAGDITIATHATTGQTLGPDWVRATALHEIGHLFGLNHSKSDGDIMASEAHALELSRADLATLRLLYALPPGAVR